ncbi:hypothetical protein MASR2M18_15760 [Ignavibacteria bacterium]|nr:hypothetical protein [Bacteroidota bacterium]MCZ2133188.1 hypothetical protein [Bacteroidota bacterium]
MRQFSKLLPKGTKPSPMPIRLAFLLALAILGGCSRAQFELLHTRKEQDYYTITTRDTIVAQIVSNAPGQRDNGVVYPSSRVLRIGQDVSQYDSLVERKYPDFIRLGLLETVGLVGTSTSDVGLGSGLFGIMGYFDPDFTRISRPFDTNRSVLFTGGIYRFGIVEKRLRWFNDAADWTFGTSIYESLLPQVSEKKDVTTLESFFPVYLRKRFYLRDKIPYVAFTPFAGLGIFPTQYANIGASLDVGSLGGLNFRAYVGAAGGGLWFSTPDANYTSAFPYAGLGLSVLDFLNRAPETYREWKDYEHSSWEVGTLQFGVLISSADTSISDVGSHSFDNKSSVIKGGILRIAPVAVALPFGNNRFYGGTSLINIVALGSKNWGAGILPLRFGYWHTLIQEELIAEPFVEFNYFPSMFLHAGANFNVNFPNKDINLKIMAGFAYGDLIGSFASDWDSSFGKVGKISGGYIGIGLGLGDAIFTSTDLRYSKEPQP